MASSNKIIVKGTDSLVSGAYFSTLFRSEVAADLSAGTFFGLDSEGRGVVDRVTRRDGKYVSEVSFMTAEQLAAERARSEGWSAAAADESRGGRTRRAVIESTVKDLVGELLYYGRKEDEDLGVGEIDEAVRSDEIAEKEIVELFAAELARNLERGDAASIPT